MHGKGRESFLGKAVLIYKATLSEDDSRPLGRATQFNIGSPILAGGGYYVTTQERDRNPGHCRPAVQRALITAAAPSYAKVTRGYIEGAASPFGRALFTEELT